MSTKREPLLSDELINYSCFSNVMATSREREIAKNAMEDVRSMYEAARAKDAEEIAKWKGIVKGVHGALNDIGTVPVPPLDADLYDVVMAIRAKDQELIQTLFDAGNTMRQWLGLTLQMDGESCPDCKYDWGKGHNAGCYQQRHLEAIEAWDAAAQGFKPSDE